MSQTYMTAKLNLTDGTIVYPQVSLDNVVNSINDPTLATIATGISISVNGGTATLVTNGGSGVAKFVGANGLVVSMNEGNEVVFTAPTVSAVDSAAYADNAGSATHATSAGIAETLVGGYVVDSATNATSAGTAAAIASGAIVAGWKNEIISGNTIGQAHWYNIINATGATVTVAPGEGYKVNAANSAVTISATLGTAGQWGPEGHMEVFVAGTGNIHTGAGVVLADALEPDSVNNCTLRFHDGECIISVEDHIAGYIVVNGSTSGEGSLYYGITTSTNDYVAFDASLNGTTIPLAGAVAEGEKHVVGNGYTETVLAGAVDCGTSKFTMANLALSNVQVTGGTMTLGDAYIPSGSTVAVSGGGGLAVEKVTGAGSDSVIDLGGTNVIVSSGSSASASGCTFSGGNAENGGALDISGVAIFNKCGFVGNIGDAGAAITMEKNNVNVSLTSCTFSWNTGNNGAVFAYRGTLTLSDTVFSSGQNIAIGASSASVILSNSNTIQRINGTGIATVTITSGAILDLTGNTNPAPIAPGGGITFEEGGATVLYSSGAVSGSYMMDNVTLPAGAKLTNTAVVDLGGGYVNVGTGRVIYASGCQFVSGTSGNEGTIAVSEKATLVDCTVTNSNRAMRVWNANQVASAIISGGSYDSILVANGGTVVLGGDVGIKLISATGSAESGTVTISSGASINLTSSINPGGGITVLTGGCTVNGNAIPAGTYTSIDSNGQPT